VPRSNKNRKSPVLLNAIQTPAKRSRSSHTKSDGEKKAQVITSDGKKKGQSPKFDGKKKGQSPKSEEKRHSHLILP
jgi:hypothetical protein